MPENERGRVFWAVALLGPMLATPALAQRPGAPFDLRTDLPFAPGAQEVRVDVTGPFVGGTYQSGVADGWYYRFTPDGDAVFSPVARLDTERVQVTCDADRKICDITADDGQRDQVKGPTGATLPEDTGPEISGMVVARVYAGWVLGGQSFALPPPKPVAKIQPPPRPLPVKLVTRVVQVKTPEKRVARMQRVPARAVSRVIPRGQVPAKTLAARVPRRRPLPAPAQLTSPPARPALPATVAVRWPAEPTLPKLPAGQGRILTTAQPQAPEGAYHPERLGCSFGFGSALTGKASLGLFCNLQATSKLTLSGSSFHYLAQSQQKPWDPDYTYVASYALTPSLSLLYANYAGNYFPWHSKPSTGGSLADGLVQATYVLPLNNQIFGARAGSFPDFSVVGGGGTTLKGKPELLLSVGITPIAKLSLRATAAYYPDQHLQEPWDGDFSYTAAYQITSRLSIQYNNYTGNRWPWHNTQGSGGRFIDGAVLLLYHVTIF